MNERIRRVLKARMIAVALVILIGIQTVMLYLIHQVFVEQQKAIKSIGFRLTASYKNIVDIKIRLKAVEGWRAGIHGQSIDKKK